MRHSKLHMDTFNFNMSPTPILDVLYTHSLGMSERPHWPHDFFLTPHNDHSDPTWGSDPSFGKPWPKSMQIECFLPSQGTLFKAEFLQAITPVRLQHEHTTKVSNEAWLNGAGGYDAPLQRIYRTYEAYANFATFSNAERKVIATILFVFDFRKLISPCESRYCATLWTFPNKKH